MKTIDYDKTNHCCKHCGTLMPDSKVNFENHSADECLRNKFYRDERNNPEVKAKFKVGETVEARVIGEITDIKVVNGKTIYRIQDKDNTGYFTETWLCALPSPEDFNNGVNQEGE